MSAKAQHDKLGTRTVVHCGVSACWCCDVDLNSKYELGLWGFSTGMPSIMHETGKGGISFKVMCGG